MRISINIGHTRTQIKIFQKNLFLVKLTFFSILLKFCGWWDNMCPTMHERGSPENKKKY